MDTKVWHKVGEKQGTVLAVTGDALYLLDFNGKNAKREAGDAAKALVGGQDPAGVIAQGTKRVPLAAIGRVEVSHGHDTVKFHATDAGKPVKVEFTVSGTGAPEIAKAVVERAGITHPERTEDIGVVEALLGPVIVGAIAGGLWAVIFGSAKSIEGGEAIDVNKGSSRGRAMKRLVAFIAETLGTNGTIAVGVLLLLAVLAWAVLRVVKRPQRLVWGPPATSA